MHFAAVRVHTRIVRIEAINHLSILRTFSASNSKVNAPCGGEICPTKYPHRRHFQKLNASIGSKKIPGICARIYHKEKLLESPTMQFKLRLIN